MSGNGYGLSYTSSHNGRRTALYAPTHLQRGSSVPLRSRQIIYSIRDLADLSGLSKPRVVRLLRSNGVELKKAGGSKSVVLLSDLEAAFPSLVDSIRFRTEDE